VRLYFRHAKELCGLPNDFEIKSEDDYHFAVRCWKEKVVDARRTNNDELAALLSQCKEVFKKRHTRLISIHCPDCENTKSRYAMRCHICARRERFYKNQLHTHSIIMKEHEIEEGLVVIPPRTHSTGVLTAVCRKLAYSGQVGDSFVTEKQPTSIKNICRMLGMEVIVRMANPEEHDKKKRRYRVWRSDGLEMEEVNERIRKRLAGEPVEPSKPCVAPAPGTVPDRHKKKGEGRGSSSSEWAKGKPKADAA
jgi:hypothetical protein